ncbi:lysozyme [Tunturiibacter gelidiferens]|uniref:lysozyme n=1 Tax=Tunturiibacter gelidiferens TaxID=3069689 RepID=UPI003D9B9FF7
MQLSNAGLNLIKTGEGFKPHLYNCPAHDASIGYGHLVHQGPICGAASEAPFAGGVSEEQGTALLLQDAAYAEHAVEHLVKVPLTQGQYDSLVSWTYNEGSGRLQTSTLLKVLNAGDYTSVPAQLMQWVYGGGVKLPGLITRRTAESEMFSNN